MSDLFWSLQLSVDAEKVEEQGAEVEEARFVFTDTGEDVTLKVLHTVKVTFDLV